MSRNLKVQTQACLDPKSLLFSLGHNGILRMRHGGSSEWESPQGESANVSWEKHKKMKDECFKMFRGMVKLGAPPDVDLLVLRKPASHK